MNKINFLFGILVLTFAFGILGSSVWGAIRLVVNLSPTPMPLPTPTPTIDYVLPYPGVLPDSPFYTIKMIRDRIVLLLTTDPINKTEKLLLYADKRLGAAQALFEGNKANLGASTVTKAEKYLEQAATEYQQAKKTNKDVSLLFQKLNLATLKLEEVLNGLANKSTGELKSVLDEALKTTLNSKSLLLKE